MAMFFAFAGAFAVLPVFQANQLTQVIRDVVLIPNGWGGNLSTDLITGGVIALLMAIVIFGGIKRIGQVTGKLVPLMVTVYIVAVLFIIFSEPSRILPAFGLILEDAFTGNAVLGGALGAIIIEGVRRAAFSNEAGIGTAPLAHGAAKTNEPVREGLVAMLGPIIDTLIVCTMTALAIIVTGVWHKPDVDGITLTAMAFDSVIPVYGPYILIVCVTFFALSTLFAFPYYGSNCVSFFWGHIYVILYNGISAASSILAAVVSIELVVAFIDSAYALMAFPNMIAAILLAPKVKKASKIYFNKLKCKEV